MLLYDRVLIFSDFNIHVCCSSSSFTSDFIKLLDSFDLTQYVKQPTHDKGHTLDLVLSYGLCVEDVKLIDFAISDHNAVLFQIPLVLSDSKPSTLICSRPLNSLSVSRFCQAFTASNSPINASQQSDFSVEELVSVFNSSCRDILDFVAPVRVRKLKPSLPWLN